MTELQQRIENLEAQVASLVVNIDQLQARTVDHQQRFDTLQSPLLRRLWFRIDGWPGQRDLNAERRSWRPWHRRS